MYYSVSERLYQCDLNAADIFGSSLLLDSIDVQPQFGLTYDKHLLAPDGKIYISSKNSAPYIHVIHKPNLRGLACMAERSGIEITYNVGISNMPYFRLGPIDGSICDSYSINGKFAASG